MSEPYGHDPENTPVSARRNPRSRFGVVPQPAAKEPNKAALIASVVIPVAIFGIPDFWRSTWMGAGAFFLIIAAVITWAESRKGRIEVARALVGFLIYVGFFAIIVTLSAWRGHFLGCAVVYGTAILSVLGWSASPRPMLLDLFIPDAIYPRPYEDEPRCEITRCLVAFDAVIILAFSGGVGF